MEGIMRSFGFTLIELLITLSLTAILLTIGLPSFSAQIQNSRVKTAMLSLHEALQLTRAQAVSSNSRATIVKQHKWDEGWEVFIDENNNGLRDENENVIIQQEKFNNVRITGNKFVKNYVSYIGSGESRNANGFVKGGAFQAGTFTICPETKGAGYELILARGGRVRMKEITEQECEDQPR
jgi:type IV fimbrial biogenesis protein FimT